MVKTIVDIRNFSAGNTKKCWEVMSCVEHKETTLLVVSVYVGIISLTTL
jgi:hypothetical protein